jgi:biopolymer transport protein ExbD
MAFGGFSKGGEGAPMADINMIPLIDVMLVLLVIFIVTAPLLSHSVKIELPRATSTPNVAKVEHVELSIRADGSLFWNGDELGAEELETRFVAAGRQEPAPELHIRADRATRYENVARVMASAARAGVSRIGFVSEPGGPS